MDLVLLLTFIYVSLERSRNLSILPNQVCAVEKVCDRREMSSINCELNKFSNVLDVVSNWHKSTAASPQREHLSGVLCLVSWCLPCLGWAAHTPPELAAPWLPPGVSWPGTGGPGADITVFCDTGATIAIIKHQSVSLLHQTLFLEINIWNRMVFSCITSQCWPPSSFLGFLSIV